MKVTQLLKIQEYNCFYQTLHILNNEAPNIPWFLRRVRQVPTHYSHWWCMLFVCVKGRFFYHLYVVVILLQDIGQGRCSMSHCFDNTTVILHLNSTQDPPPWNHRIVWGFPRRSGVSTCQVKWLFPSDSEIPCVGRGIWCIVFQERCYAEPFHLLNWEATLLQKAWYAG